MKNIRWGWVLLGGFLTELGIIIVAIPPSLVLGQESLLFIAPPASFVAALVCGLWVARKAPQRRTLHGALVGVVAMLMYVGLSLGRPEPVAYVIAHVLKVLGGAAGGYLANRSTAAREKPGRRENMTKIFDFFDQARRR